MSDLPVAAFFIIPTPVVFHLTGRDAARYLHARVSNNVRDLRIPAGCAAAALSPQGRTEVFGTVLKISAEEFYFICDGGEAESLTPLLLRYKVADRLDCVPIVDNLLLHVLAPKILANLLPEVTTLDQQPEFTPARLNNLLVLKHKRSPETGFDIIGPTAEIVALTEQLQATGAIQLDQTACLLNRIRAHRPSFPTELNDQGIFLESGLSHAVSFTKGCYVGQEVLEKVDSHGRLPFSLISLMSNASDTLPDKEAPITLKDSGAAVGEVIAAATDASTGQTLCFARIKTGALSPENKFKISNQEFQIL